MCMPFAPSPSSQNGCGRLLVLGSAHLLSDQYIDKEENGRLQEVLWQLMTSDDITLNAIDAEDPEVCVHFVKDPWCIYIYMCNLLPQNIPRFQTIISCQRQLSQPREPRAVYRRVKRLRNSTSSLLLLSIITQYTGSERFFISH